MTDSDSQSKVLWACFFCLFVCFLRSAERFGDGALKLQSVCTRGCFLVGFTGRALVCLSHGGVDTCDFGDVGSIFDAA